MPAEKFTQDEIQDGTEQYHCEEEKYIVFGHILITRLGSVYCAGAPAWARVREGNVVYLALYQAVGGFRIGNPTPVLLYRLWLSKNWGFWVVPE